MRATKTVNSLSKNLFREISYQQLITDIGHAANANCFYEKKIEDYFELIRKMNFETFLREYKKAWQKRDEINRRILTQLNNYNHLSEAEKVRFLLKKMRQLQSSLTYFFALLCFMDTTGHRGFIKIYIEKLDQLLQETSVDQEGRLSLLTPVKFLSFYNRQMIRLHQLEGQMSQGFWENPHRISEVDKKIIKDFAQKYFNGVLDIIVFKLQSIKKGRPIDTSQIKRQFAFHKKQYAAILKKIEKELTARNKKFILKEINDCLYKIQTILYYDHVYEPRRRVELALGDLLVRHLAVSLLFKKRLVTIKHPYLVPQNEIIEKLEKLI